MMRASVAAEQVEKRAQKRSTRKKKNTLPLLFPPRPSCLLLFFDLKKNTSPRAAPFPHLFTLSNHGRCFRHFR